MAIVGPIASVALGTICLALAHALGWRWGTNPQAPPAAVLVWLGYQLGAGHVQPDSRISNGWRARAARHYLVGNRER
jgi:hypothetical protein